MIEQFLRSVLEQDEAPVVLCDVHHIIVYMNPVAARRYANAGGYDLVGRSVLECHNAKSCELIEKVLAWFQADVNHNKVYTYCNKNENKDVYIVALRDEEKHLIGYYEKHVYRNHETENLYDLT